MSSACVVVRRYLDFLILLIPTPLVSDLFSPYFLLFFKMFFVLYILWVVCHMHVIIMNVI